MKTKPIDKQPIYRRVMAALPFRGSVLEFLFHLGYQGVIFPRWIRRAFARSGLHRAWLSGYTGLGILSITELT